MTKKYPEFDPERSSKCRGVLACPSCGSGFMHQCGIEVFTRDEEDAETGHHVSIEYGEQITVENTVARDDGNPSRRRDGIKIKFWCEDCLNENNPYELIIIQHKGNEYIFWSLDNDDS